MKQNRLLLGLGAGLFILAGSATAGVVNSKHDLTSLSTGTAQLKSTGTDQVCVFCHTPHGSDTAAPAPLWNKSLPTVASFTSQYTSSTMDGTADLAGSVSLACLSCHDGTGAMDSVLNMPGSGYNSGFIDGGTGVAMTGTPVPSLGKALNDDHPVSTEYAGGGIAWAAIQAGNNVADTGKDKAFNDPAFDAVSSKMTVGGTLPLYVKSAVAFVECASCHDPHDNTNGTFLRISNAKSAVCTTCHVK